MKPESHPRSSLSSSSSRRSTRGLIDYSRHRAEDETDDGDNEGSVASSYTSPRTANELDLDQFLVRTKTAKINLKNSNNSKRRSHVDWNALQASFDEPSERHKFAMTEPSEARPGLERSCSSRLRANLAKTMSCRHIGLKQAGTEPRRSTMGYVPAALKGGSLLSYNSEHDSDGGDSAAKPRRLLPPEPQSFNSDYERRSSLMLKMNSFRRPSHSVDRSLSSLFDD